MESDKTVKRTIRIPIRLNEELNRKSRLIGKTVNQVILEDLGRMYNIDIGERRRGRRWR